MIFLSLIRKRTRVRGIVKKADDRWTREWHCQLQLWEHRIPVRRVSSGTPRGREPENCRSRCAYNNTLFMRKQRRQFKKLLIIHSFLKNANSWGQCWKSRSSLDSLRESKGGMALELFPGFVNKSVPWAKPLVKQDFTTPHCVEVTYQSQSWNRL